MKRDQNNKGEEKISKPILIKKYPNRRLYNTQTSAYIVLDDIVDLIKSGTDFIVEDTKTGEDLTRSILNQVIYERETTQGDHHFPLDVQKQLILMYDDAYGKMVPDYLRESMNLFFAERDKMKSAFDDIVTHNSKQMVEFNERVAKQNVEFFNQSFELFRAMSGMKSGASEKSSEQSASTDDKQHELSDIQKQIDALQKKLKSLE
ncbi:MAG: polyhydroxyalkanoate synthesis repressor PhaR [Rhizobiaceae bacterium]|nr:polyhydroxyalkanoate synthesis repressor PhaR [Rhizobiaceae bacterium]